MRQAEEWGRMRWPQTHGKCDDLRRQLDGKRKKSGRWTEEKGLLKERETKEDGKRGMERERKVSGRLGTKAESKKDGDHEDDEKLETDGKTERESKDGKQKNTTDTTLSTYTNVHEKW